MRRKWYLFSAVLAFLLLCGVYQWYSRFISQNIYEESIEHLEEIYTQVNRTFATLVVKNWKLLDGWESYINHLQEKDSEDEITQYILEEIDKWNITEFYFLDVNGNYQTADGEKGYINLGSEYSDLMEKKENIVVDGTLFNGDSETVFAIPSKEYSINGFRYSAIAVSYSSKDMERVINVDAFSGESNCYVVSSDGEVLFSTRITEEQPENILTYLEKEGQLTEKAFESICTGLKHKVNGNLEYKCEGEKRYLVYMPIGFQDWMLIGMVPKNVVSQRLTYVQVLTTSVLAGIFILIILSGFLILIRRNRIQLDEKSMDIKYREQLFEILSNSVENIFVMFSGDGYKVDYVSPNIEKILGVSVEEIKSDIRKLGKLYTRSGKAIPLTRASQLNAIPYGGCWQNETQLSHYKTNEQHWYSETLYRACISDSEKFILVLSDRTEEKKQNQALQEALELAKSANEAKSSFLFNMSHDIRTPMNAIVGYAMLLGKDADKPEKIQDYARKITASSQHLLGLINDILDMSKIESGKTKLNIMEFSFSELLEDLNAVIMPQAKAKEQSFQIKVFSMKNEILLGDRTRISQILFNLLSNAIKYTPEKGKIELIIENLSQTSSRFARLSFKVRDNGIGMSKEFLETIYDPFVRERNSTVSKIQGTGLGMAITKNLVGIMGGTISVKSSPGMGSEFLVNLALRIPKQEVDENFWRNYGITKALTVDDEEDICTNICELMKDTGVKVSYATDGITAVSMVEKAHIAGEDYNVVLLDWKMPNIDGVETARRIRACVGADVPILILTSYDWGEIEEEAKEAGINAFLTKPFFVSGLRQTIEQMKGIDTSAKEAVESSENLSIRGMRFLVAEDNEINSELLMELLEMEEASCEIAVNGKEALEKFESAEPGSFDMILMDVQMPVMDGYQATEAIRACLHPDAETIPIAAMTANAFAEDIENAFAAGMNAHISKPIDMKVLKTTVTQLVRNKEKRLK